jgi:hypothetical protein
MENYLGGNFPQSNNPEDERATRDKVLRESRYYYRFLSFWRKHEAETIIQTLGDDRLILMSTYSSSKPKSDTLIIMSIWMLSTNQERVLKTSFT